MQKSGAKKECKICQFDAYVEVCHIKPIFTFDSTTKLLEVNDIENLVYLCPNHHILLDKGLISL